MLYVDIPTAKDLETLRAVRDEAAVSLYFETTPVTQDIDKAIITFGNMSKQALDQLAAAGIDKRRHASLAQELDDLAEDDEFWRYQATPSRSLPPQTASARFACPIRSPRLLKCLTASTSSPFYVQSPSATRAMW